MWASPAGNLRLSRPEREGFFGLRVMTDSLHLESLMPKVKMHCRYFLNHHVTDDYFYTIVTSVWLLGSANGLCLLVLLVTVSTTMYHFKALLMLEDATYTENRTLRTGPDFHKDIQNCDNNIRSHKDTTRRSQYKKRCYHLNYFLYSLLHSLPL